ncbi:DUF6660 family protein [Ascidiimonas sp. W6]|uniref:DUF6660 family protein n=1 Tax=Ascidiimonas meishanensis TaxID=3128903 RepID=UPI0030ED4675
MPCSDTAETKDDSQVVFVVDFDGEHDQGCELCSPFCECQCCHCHSIDFGIVPFEPLQPVIPQDNFAHFDSLGKDIPLSLFQPPRA